MLIINGLRETTQTNKIAISLKKKKKKTFELSLSTYSFNILILHNCLGLRLSGVVII